MFDKIANKLLKKAERKGFGDGLFVSVEELLEQQKYTKYLQKYKLSSHDNGDIVSVFKGRGIELDEVRKYDFNDDARDIEWRVTARKQSPYTKIYTQEKNHEIYVLLDLSSSMFFGTIEELKSVKAAKMAALLGWAALENKDRFGCVVFNGSKFIMFKAGNRRDNLLALFKHISSASQEGLKNKEFSTSSLLKPLQILSKNIKHKATVFVISDFQGWSDAVAKSLAMLAKSSRVYCLDVADSLEEMPPRPGEYMVKNQKEGLVFDSYGKSFQAEYVKHFADKRQKIESFCRKYGAKYVKIKNSF